MLFKINVLLFIENINALKSSNSEETEKFSNIFISLSDVINRKYRIYPARASEAVIKISLFNYINKQ